MITAAIGAAIVGHWEEGAILLGLFSTSNALEHHALGRTQRAVRALMELSPEVATVLRDGEERVVPIEELRLGEVVLVRPGERVPVDGCVLAGETAIDQSAITGESIPVDKRIGDTCFAGTINSHGAIQVRVDRLHQESTLARIVQFVEQAQAEKSDTQRFTDRFEGWYAVGVIAFSTLVGVIPPLVLGQDWEPSIYRAITLLVVASPCALVISTPASTLSGLANAARNGILFKGSASLEDIGETRAIAFDKTGTLTYGRPALTDVIALGNGWSEERLLRLAASAERLSEHHMAVAIVRGAEERELPLGEAVAFRAFPGMGIAAEVDGDEVLVGNDMLFAEFGVAVPAQTSWPRRTGCATRGRRPSSSGTARRCAGLIAVADTVRPSAQAVIAELKAQGIARIVMLTGDNRRVADAIGAELGIDEVYADLLPEEKLRIIDDLKADRAGDDGRRRGERRAGAGHGEHRRGDGWRRHRRRAGDRRRGADGGRPHEAPVRHRPQPAHAAHHPPEPRLLPGRDRHPGRRHPDPRHPPPPGRGRPRGQHGHRRPQRVAAAEDERSRDGWKKAARRLVRRPCTSPGPTFSAMGRFQDRDCPIVDGTPSRAIKQPVATNRLMKEPGADADLHNVITALVPSEE